MDNAPVCDAVRSGRRCPHPLHLSQTHAPGHEAAEHPANDGITFMGNAFGSAAYLAELLPIYVSRAVSRIANPPKRP